MKENEIKITESERKVLESIPSSEYICLDKSDRNVINNPTWVFTCEDSGIKGKSLSGVISSLVKKGLVYTDVENGDEIISLTEYGFLVLNR